MPKEPDAIVAFHNPDVLLSSDKKLVVISAQIVGVDKDGRPALTQKTVHLKTDLGSANLLLQQLETLRPIFGGGASSNQLKAQYSPPKSEKH